MAILDDLFLDIFLSINFVAANDKAPEGGPTPGSCITSFSCNLSRLENISHMKLFFLCRVLSYSKCSFQTNI